MKIIRSRLWPQGRRQAIEAAVAAAAAVAENAVPQNPEVEKKKNRKKALLIGCQEVRDQPTSPVTPGPLSPLSTRFNRSDNFAVNGLKRVKTKIKEKKSIKESLLKGPHRDVEALRKLLIEVYGYDSEDIVVLIDNDLPGHKQPTEDSIMEEMRRLVAGAQEGDRFFFHFSGHSIQEDTDDISEEDRKNEFIETSDGKRIKDDILKETLVDPLPAGASLIVLSLILVTPVLYLVCIFHFEGADKNLKHFRCNRVYVPWVNKGYRRTASLWNNNSELILVNENRMKLGNLCQLQRASASQIVPARDVITVAVSAEISMHNPIARLKTHAAGAWARSSIDQVLVTPTDSMATHEGTANGVAPGHIKSKLSITTDQLVQSTKLWLDSPGVRQECSSPVALYCTGYCRHHALYDESDTQANVISISSAKDGQKSWEDKNGTSMTQVLVKILSKQRGLCRLIGRWLMLCLGQDPHPTLEELMTLVSHDIHAFYVDLHTRAREYRKQVKIANEKKRKKGKQPKQGDTVEMNNFQNPQSLKF
ncbi:hypothetical protein CVT25_010475 [Psilocybe cyanescens]|uniref:Peptidase C14 caspase domain-containing protein n=1 Tax=Psilocybe cyanescens TaxID=93625 RepID=A0A409XDA9_PSICY|nr:hypothetical protein CVT25_010475 [Psilocybe cyanescens]